MTTLVRPVHSDPGDNSSATDLTVLLDTYADLIETVEAAVAAAVADITTAQTDIATLQVDTHDDQHSLGGASHLGQATFVQLPGLYARVTADRSFTSETLANVTDGAIALETNSTYRFTANLLVDGATNGDVKVGFDVPTGSTIKWTGIGGDVTTPATLVSTVVQTDAGSASYGTLGTGTTNSILISGLVRTGGTAGNMQLQAARVAANGTTKVLTDSDLLAWKVV